jgi:uncharacterized protein YueI
MPTPDYQRPILSTFRQRVSKTLTTASNQRLHISNPEAEQKVWRELEEELLNLPDEAYGPQEI